MMDAHALDLAVHPVQGESGIGIEGKGTDADRQPGPVQFLLAGGQGYFQRIQVRVVNIPLVRSRDLQVHLLPGLRLGGSLGNHLAGGIFQRKGQPCSGRERSFDLRINGDDRLFRRHGNRPVPDAPQGEMGFAGADQPDIPVNTGAGIEAGIRHPAMVDTHGKDIVAFPVQVGCHVVQERRIAAWALAQQMAVQVNGRPVIHAFKIDKCLPCRQFTSRKMLPVPPDTCREISGTGGIVRRHRSFDGPVVRKLDRRPGGIIESRGLGPGDFFLDKNPTVIEQGSRPEGRLCGGRNGR